MPNQPPKLQDLVLWFKTLVPTSRDRQQHETILRQLADQLPTSALPGIDYDMRWRDSWKTERWNSMTTDEVDLLLAQASDIATVAAGLSMHRNGYIRQRAVVALDQAGTSSAVRWLVLRSGDWVPQVRDQATKAMSRWLDPLHAMELVDSLPLLDGERFSPERPAYSLRTAILSVLNEPASLEAIQRGAQSEDRQVRRACTKMLIESNADIALLKRTIDTGDVVTIAMVAAVMPTERGSVNSQVGRLLLQSPMARFRYEGLWRLTKDSDPGSERLIAEGLIDAAPSVRDVSRRWLSDRGRDTDLIYRSMLAENPLSALRGLGDRPQSEDADQARRYVDDENGPVRIAALRLLSGIGATADGPLFAERFNTGTRKERRHALVGLRRIGPDRFIDHMWDQALGDTRRAERLLVQVLPSVERWKRIDIALRAVVSEETRIRAAGHEVLWQLVVNWNQGYPGKPPNLELLRQRLNEARPAFGQEPNQTYTTLEFLLRPPSASQNN